MNCHLSVHYFLFPARVSFECFFFPLHFHFILPLHFHNCCYRHWWSSTSLPSRESLHVISANRESLSVSPCMSQVSVALCSKTNITRLLCEALHTSWGSFVKLSTSRRINPHYDPPPYLWLVLYIYSRICLLVFNLSLLLHEKANNEPM